MPGEGVAFDATGAREASGAVQRNRHGGDVCSLGGETGFCAASHEWTAVLLL